MPNLAPIILNGLLLCFAAATGLIIIIKRPKPIWLILLLSIVAGGGFAILMNDRGLPWWGLLGDEAFIGAAITKAWHGIYWSDFYYANLPPFYPPLYFWTVGFFGQLFNLPPIGAMNAGVAMSLFLLPIVIYVGIRLLPSQFIAEQKWFAFLAAGFTFIVSEWIGFLSKPFEFLTAAITIIWVLHVVTYAKNNKTKFTPIALGIIGALIIWTYYFWMIFAIVAIALVGIKYAPQNRKQWYGKLATIFGISSLLSSPFWITLLHGAFVGGEAWQASWFTQQDLIPFATLLHGLPAIVALIGIGTVITFRKKIIPFTLGMIFLAPLLWWVTNLITLSIFEVAFIPTKAMHFISAYALAFAAAWGTARAMSRITAAFSARAFLATLFIIFLFFVPSGLFAYKFGNDHITSLTQSKETKEIIDFLASIDHIQNKTALVSEQPLIVGQIPLNIFLSFNMHFTHPQANWSERYLVVHEMATALTPEEFAGIAKNNSIDLLVLTKNEARSTKHENLNYQLFLWRDKFPNGGYDQTISFPASLVSEKYWIKLFENKQFAVWSYRETSEISAEIFDKP